MNTRLYGNQCNIMHAIHEQDRTEEGGIKEREGTQIDEGQPPTLTATCAHLQPASPVFFHVTSAGVPRSCPKPYCILVVKVEGKIRVLITNYHGSTVESMTQDQMNV